MSDKHFGHVTASRSSVAISSISARWAASLSLGLQSTAPSSINAWWWRLALVSRDIGRTPASRTPKSIYKHDTDRFHWSQVRDNHWECQSPYFQHTAGYALVVARKRRPPALPGTSEFCWSACLRSSLLRGYQLRGTEMTSEADADQDLLRRIRTGDSPRPGRVVSRISGSACAGWSSSDWTGGCRGASTRRT